MKRATVHRHTDKVRKRKCEGACSDFILTLQVTAVHTALRQIVAILYTKKEQNTETGG